MDIQLWGGTLSSAPSPINLKDDGQMALAKSGHNIESGNKGGITHTYCGEYQFVTMILFLMVLFRPLLIEQTPRKCALLFAADRVRK